MMQHNQRSQFVLSLLGSLFLFACGGAQEAPPQVPPPAATNTPSPVAPALSASAPAPAASTVEAPRKAEEHHAAHWTYGGDTGPAHWGDLSAEWATCKTGTSQSPIDLVTKAATTDAKLGALEFKYGKLPLSIFNNGHTVQVPNDKDYTVTVSGQTYKLAQFHLHTPSEHLVNGKPADMELHLVHKNDKGALTVVGILFKKGKENKALAPVFANAPSEVTAEAKPVEKAELDLTQILPSKRNFYNYSGSLTTPPCSEGVNWVVLETPAEVSEAQIAKFREVTHGDTIRPAQPLGTRKVSRNK
jgi:carbonic anhydrase